MSIIVSNIQPFYNKKVNRILALFGDKGVERNKSSGRMEVERKKNLGRNLLNIQADNMALQVVVRLGIDVP